MWWYHFNEKKQFLVLSQKDISKILLNTSAIAACKVYTLQRMALLHWNEAPPFFMTAQRLGRKANSCRAGSGWKEETGKGHELKVKASRSSRHWGWWYIELMRWLVMRREKWWFRLVDDYVLLVSMREERQILSNKRGSQNYIACYLYPFALLIR